MNRGPEEKANGTAPLSDLQSDTGDNVLGLLEGLDPAKHRMENESVKSAI